MKSYLRTAILLSMGTLLGQAAIAQTTDSAVVAKEKAIRLEVKEKQQALEHELRIAAPAPVAAPAAPLELPIDETDSPGATN